MNAHIFYCGLFNPILREGARGSVVSRLQKKLNDMGYSPGEPDGIFGYKTKTAVMELQRTYRLKADGIVGRKTWHIINNKRLPGNRSVHIVGPEDTLTKIAKLHGTTAAALMRANKLGAKGNRHLIAGQKLAVIDRLLLFTSCGQLEDSVSVVPIGLRTGAVYEFADDGEFIQRLTGDFGGLPVVKLSSNLIFLKSKGTMDEAVRKIKGIAHKAGEESLMLIISGFDAMLSTRLITFLAALRRNLGSTRFILAIAVVPPKRLDKPAKLVLDPKSIIKYVDFIMPMLWLPKDGNAGPIAPLPWVRVSLKALTESIEPWQLILGVPGHARKWNITAGKCDDVPFSTVRKVLSAYGTKPEWDMESSSPVFAHRRRGEQFEYWFENTDSVKEKACLADKLNLAGIAVFDGAWADPEIHESVGEVFRIGTILNEFSPKRV